METNKPVATPVAPTAPTNGQTASTKKRRGPPSDNPAITCKPTAEQRKTLLTFVAGNPVLAALGINVDVSLGPIVLALALKQIEASKVPATK